MTHIFNVHLMGHTIFIEWVLHLPIAHYNEHRLHIFSDSWPLGLWILFRVAARTRIQIWNRPNKIIIKRPFLYSCKWESSCMELRLYDGCWGCIPVQVTIYRRLLIIRSLRYIISCTIIRFLILQSNPAVITYNRLFYDSDVSVVNSCDHTMINIAQLETVTITTPYRMSAAIKTHLSHRAQQVCRLWQRLAVQQIRPVKPYSAEIVDKYHGNQRVPIGHTTLLRRWINVNDVDPTSQQRRVPSGFISLKMSWLAPFMIYLNTYFMGPWYLSF